jgi:hypothetical protein
LSDAQSERDKLGRPREVEDRRRGFAAPILAIERATTPSVAAKPRLVARIAALAALEIVQTSFAALRRFQHRGASDGTRTRDLRRDRPAL